ncbi:unnamed protein product [Triticum turgidum subsp. durum]|uniref:DEAD-box RNA helicase Q domain-containing protein n=1 Tax=Triticum turgidum subsp. durum TaxID=4567 RepID=A0A9R0TIN4_TRITD|nr:unnamed protein product [Triticum turgidum subsp. durum]
MYAMIRRADPLRRRAASAILAALLQHPAGPSAAGASASVLPPRSPLPPPAMWFHSRPAPLGFRETGAARAGAHAQFAADEGWNYDDKRKPAGGVAGAGAGAKEEGLEIAKLGISSEIVDKLSAKGITKLFPIQSCP